MCGECYRCCGSGGDDSSGGGFFSGALELLGHTTEP